MTENQLELSPENYETEAVSVLSNDGIIAQWQTKQRREYRPLIRSNQWPCK